MGFPWFGTPKKLQSPRFNIFSSKSRRPTSESSKDSSRSRRRKYSASENIISGDFANNCPLPSADELENVFKTFDANSDGKISASEMREVMGSLGHQPSDEELRLIMAEADSDGDGFVDLTEFVGVNTRGVDGAAALSDLQGAFRMFDLDGDGGISAQELHNVLGKLGESCSLAECHNMIGGVDSDGDGRVSFHDFFAMMTKPNLR